MRRVRFDINHRAGLNLYDIVVQFHLATSLQDVVHLSAFAVVVLHGVLDQGHVEVTDRGVREGEWPRALAAFAADRGGVPKAADEVNGAADTETCEVAS